jgi:malonate transporter
LFSVALADWHRPWGRISARRCALPWSRTPHCPWPCGALGWALGLSGLPLAVMVTAAALPVGANVFLFAQRYEVGQDEMTAGVTVSTALGMATVPVVLWVVTRWAV